MPPDGISADLEWLTADPRAARIAIEREMVKRGGLKVFIRLAWHIIEPGTQYVPNWHIDAICDELDAVSRGENTRLLIGIPPRSMKSTIVAVMWPAFDWIEHPSRRFLYASYNANLATRDNMRTRRIVESPWYRERWGDIFYIAKDQNTKTKFENSRTGSREVTSVGGQTTGLGADIVCFPGHEIVWTELGPMLIGDIVRGRLNVKVWSFDPFTRQMALKPLTGWHTNRASEVLRVNLSDGGSFECTPEHLVWTENRGWAEAQNLALDDVLPDFAPLDGSNSVNMDIEPAGEIACRLGAVADKTHSIFGEFRQMVAFASRTVGVKPFRDRGPRGAPANVGNRRASDVISSSKLFGSFGTLRNFLGEFCGKFCAWAPFEDRESAVSFRVSDVFRPGPVFKVAQGSHGGIAVFVSNLLSRRRASDKGQHHDLVDEQMLHDAVTADIEAGVAFAQRRLNQSTVNFELLPFAHNDARDAAHAPVVRNLIGVVTGYRQPAFVESVGHANETFCLSVADFGTFFVGSQVLIHNCLDDPNNVLQAESSATRETTLTWWNEAMPSRLNDQQTGAFVVVQQRVNEADVTGDILRRTPGLYRYICLPAEYDPQHPYRYDRDIRTEPGELLWPAKFTREAIERLKKALGSYAASSQLQQLPSPRSGGLFKAEWLIPLPTHEMPADIRWVRAWDIAASEKTIVKADPDYTATAKVGRSESTRKFYIGHVQRWRVEMHMVKQLMLQIAVGDGPDVTISVPQDPGAAGKGLAQEFLSLLSAFPTFADRPTGDKVTRATAFAGQLGGGMMRMVQGDWNEEFVAELVGFPTGAHDDMIDAVSSAYNRLVQGETGLIDYYASMLGGQTTEKPQTDYGFTTGQTTNMGVLSR